MLTIGLNVRRQEPDVPEVGGMDNYYKSPSPQELRYRDVLDAIAAMGPGAKELADELDQVVWQIVSRAVDAAIAAHDQRILGSITGGRPPESSARGATNRPAESR